MKKTLLKVGVVAMALASLAGVGSGCAYGAMAIAQDGTVFVARNDSFLFGALRKVFAQAERRRDDLSGSQGAP